MEQFEWINQVKKIAQGIRKRTLEHTIKNGGGYLSQACSSAEILATLYTKVMNLGTVENPIKPKPFPGVPGAGNSRYFTGAEFHGARGKEYDRFFLSPAQYALVVYSALIETKRMAEDGLDYFNKDGYSVEMIGAEHSPGMEVTTGSLGQGISQAAGIAFARKRKGETGRIIVFLSDGELQIGQTWEALQAMAFHKLDNMILYIDVNGYQCDGKMTTVMNVEPIEKRLESFGLKALRIDGHNIEAIAQASESKPDGRPLAIVCDTNPTKDMEILCDRAPKFHYVRFANNEEKQKYILFSQDVALG
ncbi:MAG: transketolase [Candidatus Brocadiae bacterium]|nr:transketolase [Candidatus Brocadiia bacterium]